MLQRLFRLTEKKFGNEAKESPGANAKDHMTPSELALPSSRPRTVTQRYFTQSVGSVASAQTSPAMIGIWHRLLQTAHPEILPAESGS
jgi:hypothetical protein